MVESLFGNATSLAERMFSHFSDQLFSVGKPHIVAAALVVFVMAIATIVTPKLDPREPPLIAPRFPLVGHLLGLMINRVGYFSDLYSRTGLPIATLPIVHRKLYVINSAPLQQAAMRAKNMDAQSFTVEFIPCLFGVTRATLDRLLGRDGVKPSIAGDMERVFQTTLSGRSLEQLTLGALACFGETLNGIAVGEEVRIPNLYMWLRQAMSRATSQALWGKANNPYGGGDEEVINAQWDFEANMGPLVLGILPSVIARTADQARKRVQTALRAYYSAELDQRDPAASEFVRSRTKLLRHYDLPAEELSKNEVSIMLAATTNTIPTLFWYVAHVWMRPDLVSDLRAEVAPILDDQGPAAGSGQRTVVVDTKKLETLCPLLSGCYREAVRLASQIITFRRVLEDTLISDGRGASYLLKAGCDVMMPAKVVHRHTETWGHDAELFDPRRFAAGAGPETERLRRASFVPFGGGKHLCPGRHFAFAENLAIMAVLVSGFEIRGLRADRLRMRDSKMGEAAKPVEGFEGGPVVLKRRKGREDVQWKFTV